VECDLVRLAVIKASPEDIAELRRVNEKMKRPNLSEQEYWDFDIEFHTTLASMSANTVMITVYDMISTIYHRYEGKVKKLYDVQMTTYSNHKALIGAIEEKDVEKACEIVNRSMSISEEAIYNLNKVAK
jgi:DNA-binding FadR family transcriptional regulator